MVSAPVPFESFDYRDKAQFSALYHHYGSCDRMASEARSAGVDLKANTLNKWRAVHGIQIAQEAYRRRGEEPEAEESEAADELLKYLRSRYVPVAPGPTASKKEGGYATCLVGGDLHFPHHHEGAFEVFLGLVDIIKPDELVLNGDIWDFSQIGRYPQKPQSIRGMQEDLDECREKVLARVNASAPDATKRLILGNHEEGRWQRYLWTRAPELASLRCLTMEALLGMAEMGWSWQPFEYWPTDSLIITHGDRHTNTLGGGSAMSARKEMIDMGCSGVSGHTHHAGAFFRQDRVGYRVWYEAGCLCDWSKMQAAGVTPQRTPVKQSDWHLACALVHYRPEHSAFRVELVPIVDDGKRTFTVWRDEEIVA